MLNQHCLDVVRKNKQKIVKNILAYLKYKGDLTLKEIFVCKSRVAGTCRPDSDIDVYVQLDEKHRDLVESQGGAWGGKMLKGIWGAECSKELAIKGLRVIDIVHEDGAYKGHHITLDIMCGVDPYPPSLIVAGNPKYEGKKWFMKLSEI